MANWHSTITRGEWRITYRCDDDENLIEADLYHKGKKVDHTTEMSTVQDWITRNAED